MKYYGVEYDSGDHWGTILVKLIDAYLVNVNVNVNVNDEYCYKVYIEWSDYHNAYKLAKNETKIMVMILPCAENRIDEEDEEC